MCVGGVGVCTVKLYICGGGGWGSAQLNYVCVCVCGRGGGSVQLNYVCGGRGGGSVQLNCVGGS